MENNDKLLFMIAKRRVERILNTLNKLARKGKITEEGKNTLKAMNDFLKCNLNSSSIKSKYDAIVEILNKYKEMKKAD